MTPLAILRRRSRALSAAFVVSAVTAAANGAPALADGMPMTEQLTPTNKAAMSITGTVRLRENGNNTVRTIVFENGRSLAVTGGFDGVYRVVPPANPVLLHGNRLCAGAPATRVALTWGIHGAVTMLVYRGASMTDATLCAMFDYTTSRTM